MALKFDEAWGLAQDNIRTAQRQQKAYYDRQSRPPRFNIGDRVLVYMPVAKATKAYKFARPFHGPYRIIEQSDTGVTVRPIDKPQTDPIRVAYNRIRHCCNSLPDKFWPTRAKGNARSQQVNRKDSNNPWNNRLRSRWTGGDT